MVARIKSEAPKVAIVNSVYGFGSTGTMAKCLNRWFNDKGWGAASYFGRRDNDGDASAVLIGGKARVCLHAMAARITGYEGWFSWTATRRLVRLLDQSKPDVAVLLNLHGYYLNRPMLFEWLARTGTPVLYIMPDEYPFLGKCPFSGDCDHYLHGCGDCRKVKEYPKSILFDRSKKIFAEKKRAYGRFSRLIFAGPEYGLEKAARSPLTQGFPLEVLDWGIDTVGDFTLHDMAQVRDELGLSQDKKIILALGSKDDPRKGIADYFYPAASNNPEDLFVHIGANVDRAEQEGNILKVPYMNDQRDLSKWCSAADALMLTSVQDMQPLAALSALASGTPIACFPVSGMPHMLKGCPTCWIPSVSVEAASESVGQIPRKTPGIARECREYAANRYSNETFCGRVEQLCERLMG